LTACLKALGVTKQTAMEAQRLGAPAAGQLLAQTERAKGRLDKGSTTSSGMTSILKARGAGEESID
jgi:hypothetical protein